MNSRPIGSAPPPFYWKVPVPEKDYMSENYRRIRQIANQSQKKRNEPMKAAFIPGVTKNEKYAHVTSRVGESLKPRRIPENVVNDGPLSASAKRPQPQRATFGGNQPINRRLSKSSTDLRPNNSSQPTSGMKNSVPPNQQTTTQLRRRRGSQESFQSNQESVYNWRFRDDVNEYPPGARFSNNFQNSSIPAKLCHRVEYLPCDGICAEENFVVDDGAPESARSASSCRTSRGCNTEETRILDDPVKSFELDKQSTDNAGDIIHNFSREPSSKPPQGSKIRSVHTIPSQEHFGRKSESGQWYKANGANNESIQNNVADMMKAGREKSEMNRAKTSVSNTSLKSGKQSQTNGIGGGGDFPHNLGSVPKYLKQRQEEWKVQERERKESEINANVPHGYVLLSENERVEHMKTFKRNYDTLINELNRIPIRIDTIRVREHKIQLEQQLTRLEEAMKTFSRPRVWIKVDD